MSSSNDESEWGEVFRLEGFFYGLRDTSLCELRSYSNIFNISRKGKINIRSMQNLFQINFHDAVVCQWYND